MITCYKVKDITVIGLVIKSVEAMASEQGIEKIKIQGNNKVPLHPVNCIAGSDYDYDYNDDNENDKNQNQNEYEEYRD